MTASDQGTLSVYENKAWEDTVKRLNKQSMGGARQLTARATAPVVRRAGQVWDRTPGHTTAEEQVRRALEGLTTVTLQPAMNSVNLQRVCRRLGVEVLSEVRGLDLERVDQAVPRTRTAYAVGALLQGSATAAAVTGAEVSATVSGGTTVGVAAGAIAVDAAASLAMMGRIVALVAAHYGYDVRQPEEEAFALGVISVGTASTPPAKVAALSSLSRLTQRMMRQATMSELNRHGVVKLIEQVFKALGFRLTRRKLGQAVPVAGIVINGGMSAQLADSTFRNARDLYRLRFLTDKYGLDPADWLTEASVEVIEDDVLGPALDELESEQPGS
jgi:hypothetical protein